MKNLFTALLFVGMAYCCLPQMLQAQCGAGQTFDTYCYTNGLVDEVAFELCPTAGMAMSADIIDGSFFAVTNDNLTVYAGASGSGTSGVLIFGPATGNVSGNSGITSGIADECLIFVVNSNTAGIPLGCTAGTELPLEVCSQSVAASSSVSLIISPDEFCSDDGVQMGLNGGSPAGGTYSGMGVTDNGDDTFDFDPTGLSGAVTITYTQGGNMATDNITVLATGGTTFTALSDLCIDAGEQMGLSGGAPGGGTFSGPGVTDNGDGTYNFNPAIAGLGVHTISYTDGGVCMETVTDDVEVLAACGCPSGFTNHFYCAGNMEPSTVAFEVCPTAGMAAQATITSGTFSTPPITDGDELNVYSGVTGSGTGGTLIQGPLSGDLTGTVISGSVADDCLIFVVTTGNLGSCQDGSETGLAVCGESIAPSVTFLDPGDFCSDDGAQILGGGLPMGGIYSGPGVTDDANGMTFTFDPSIAGVGQQVLTYTLGGGSDDVTIEVFGANITTFTALPDLCIDAGIQTNLGGGSPAGGTYTGNGVTDNGDGTYDFNPAIAGLGTTVIIYVGPEPCLDPAADFVEVTAACGCPAGEQSFFYCQDNNESDVVMFEVCPTSNTMAVQATITQGTYGVDDGLSVYSGASGSGTSGTLVQDNINGNLANTVSESLAEGACLIFVNTTGPVGSCQDGFETAVQVCAVDIPPPTAFMVANDVCINDGVLTLSGGTPSGGTYSGTGVFDDGNGMTFTFDPAIAGVGPTTITYSANGDDAMDDILVSPAPNVMLNTAAGYCIDAPIATTTITGGSPDGGVYSGPGVTDNGLGTGYLLDPTVGGPGTITITYTYTDPGTGCTASATSNLDIFDCEEEITQACACLDNASIIDLDAGTGGDDGQFSELISVVDGQGGMLPAGQIWTITSAMGAFDADDIPAVGAQSTGVPVAEDGSVMLAYNATLGTYELAFVHVDAMGYSITVEGPFGQGSPVNSTLTFTNNCSYPNPTFDPMLADSYCGDDPIVNLGAADTEDVGADMISFTVNGNPATAFDPSTLGAGVYTIVMMYDGSASMVDVNGSTFPGCIQEVQKQVSVGTAPATPVVNRLTRASCVGATSTVSVEEPAPGTAINWMVIAAPMGASFMSGDMIGPGENEIDYRTDLDADGRRFRIKGNMNVVPGTYLFQAFAVDLTSGCESDMTMEVFEINIYMQPTVEITADPDGDLCLGQMDVQYDATIMSMDGGTYTYAWCAYNSGDGSGTCFDGFDDNTVQMPMRSWTTSAGPKSVEVTVESDVNGCTATDLYSFEVVAPTMIECPADLTTTLITDDVTFDCLATATFNNPSVDPGPCDPVTLTISIDGGTPETVVPGDPYTATFDALGEYMVTYILVDALGNTSTCSFLITVDGLPCGWVDNGGIGCTGNTSSFDQMSETFTLDAPDCSPEFPYTSDESAFVFTELCGDGEIIALVSNVTGTGYAGVQMRASEMPDAPKVAIGTNTVNRVRREIRVLPSYPAFPQAILAYDQFWVRITRTGPTFRGFASPDGVTWLPYIFQTIQMPACVRVGLYTYSEKPDSPISASFENVFVTGLGGQNLTGGNTGNFIETPGSSLEQTLSPTDIRLFPNPTSGVINIDLSNYLGEAVDIRLYNAVGQEMMRQQVQEVQVTIEQLNLSHLEGGIYTLVLQTGAIRQSKRLVISR